MIKPPQPTGMSECLHSDFNGHTLVAFIARVALAMNTVTATLCSFCLFWCVHVGMLRDYPTSKLGDKAIAVGLGYGFVRLVNNINVEQSQQSYLYNVPEAQRALRNVFSYHQLQLPVELRWRNSSPSEYAFWRLYLGYRLSYQFGTQYQPFFGRKFSLVNQLNEIKPWA